MLPRPYILRRRGAFNQILRRKSTGLRVPRSSAMSITQQPVVSRSTSRVPGNSSHEVEDESLPWTSSPGPRLRCQDKPPAALEVPEYVVRSVKAARGSTRVIRSFGLTSDHSDLLAKTIWTDMFTDLPSDNRRRARWSGQTRRILSSSCRYATFRRTASCSFLAASLATLCRKLPLLLPRWILRLSEHMVGVKEGVRISWEGEFGR